MTLAPDGILFDLDGTLVDTAPDLAAATNRLRQDHRLAPLELADIRPQVSNGANALVTLALGIESGDAEHAIARQRLLGHYEAAVALHSRVFSPLDQWLDLWIEAGRAWGVVTNKPRRYADPLVAALGLTPDILICADDLPVRKPSPDPLIKAAQAIGMETARCWYIGDHLRDMEAARAARMTAVAVGYGYTSFPEEYLEWPADRYYQSCEDLVAALPIIR